jgi:hypothetical protein
MNILWYLDSFYFHGQGSSNGFSVEKMVGLCNSLLDGASCDAAAPRNVGVGVGHRTPLDGLHFWAMHGVND